MISGCLKKVVVDRAGLPYSRQIRRLTVANRYFRPTEMLAIRKQMANLKRAESGLQSTPGPDHKRERSAQWLTLI